MTAAVVLAYAGKQYAIYQATRDPSSPWSLLGYGTDPDGASMTIGAVLAEALPEVVVRTDAVDLCPGGNWLAAPTTTDPPDPVGRLLVEIVDLETRADSTRYDAAMGGGPGDGGAHSLEVKATALRHALILLRPDIAIPPRTPTEHR